MKRWLALLLCLLVAMPAMAPAEGLTPLEPYGDGMEAAALSEGLEVRTVTTFAYGGLPLLDEELDTAIDSLAKTLRLQTGRQQGEGGGYVTADVFLRDESVVDMAILAKDGVYYEVSNLLGGETVAFTKEEFADFTRGLAKASGGALPDHMAWLFEMAMLALGGRELPIDAPLLDSALRLLSDWEADALTEREVLRPTVSLPGIYGTKALEADITREEALSLAEAFIDLLAQEDALWEQAALYQVGPADAGLAGDVLSQVKAALPELPDMLGLILPAEEPLSTYRKIYDRNDKLVAHQLQIALAGDGRLSAEWAAEGGTPSLYLSIQEGEGRVSLILTEERGTPTGTKEQKWQDRWVGEFSYGDGATTLNLLLTKTADHALREDREIVATKTDVMMESPALFGEDTLITLSIQAKDTAKGEGTRYKREHVMEIYVKGLGFDNRKVLTINQETTLREANPPMDLEDAPLRPAQLSAEELAAWLASTRISFQQAVFTCFGRLPRETAAYILSLL